MGIDWERLKNCVWGYVKSYDKCLSWCDKCPKNITKEVLEPFTIEEIELYELNNNIKIPFYIREYLLKV
jgi:hypothetical protein